MTLRLAIVGDGKMGRAVAQLAVERGWPVVATIGRADNEGGVGITRERLNGADVAVEFTTPTAAPDNVRACVRAGCPVVVGTTGWYAELPGVEREVRAADGAMLWAPNFALGVHVFWQVAEYAASLVTGVPGMDAHIVEIHHVGKRDAPSGSAAELSRRVSEPLGRTVPVTSVRLGAVPGTHELVFDGGYEQIRLEHVARDRRVFADGALTAAHWLVGRRGVFEMRDLLSRGSAP